MSRGDGLLQSQINLHKLHHSRRSNTDPKSKYLLQFWCFNTLQFPQIMNTTHTCRKSVFLKRRSANLGVPRSERRVKQENSTKTQKWQFEYYYELQFKKFSFLFENGSHLQIILNCCPTRIHTNNHASEISFSFVMESLLILSSTQNAILSKYAQLNNVDFMYLYNLYSLL